MCREDRRLETGKNESRQCSVLIYFDFCKKKKQFFPLIENQLFLLIDTVNSSIHSIMTKKRVVYLKQLLCVKILANIFSRMFPQNFSGRDIRNLPSVSRLKYD